MKNNKEMRNPKEKWMNKEGMIYGEDGSTIATISYGGNEEDAKRICRCVNNFDKLLDTCKMLLNNLQAMGGKCGVEQAKKLIEKIEEDKEIKID